MNVTYKNEGQAVSRIKKLVVIATTGAIAVVPFLAATTAEAQPPAHAPAHGYRNKNHGKDTSEARRNKEKKDKEDRDQCDDDYRRDGD